MNVTVTYEPLTDDLTPDTPDYLTTLITDPTPSDSTDPRTGTRTADNTATCSPIPAGGGFTGQDNLAARPDHHRPHSTTSHRRRRLGIGTLGNGHRISPATVRRLACDTRILPAVLGTDSQILDVGRTKRLIDKALRQALVLRDHGCAFPGCTRPARWSGGHHMNIGPTSAGPSGAIWLSAAVNVRTGTG